MDVLADRAFDMRSGMREQRATAEQPAARCLVGVLWRSRAVNPSATIVASSAEEILAMGLPLAQPSLQRADFLAWEADQSVKHEFLSGEVFAMVGARQEHVVVSLALAARLREHLRGTRCRAYTSNMKLEVLAADAVFYPDVMVSCDEADRQRPLAIQSPCLVVEVLSDATAAFDRGAKFAAYRQLPSLQEYLLVDIARRRLELFRREPVGWVLHEPQGEPATLMLASVDLALREADAFEDLVE
jgi:Uma2 family endonuclease